MASFRTHLDQQAAFIAASGGPVLGSDGGGGGGGGGGCQQDIRIRSPKLCRLSHRPSSLHQAQQQLLDGNKTVDMGVRKNNKPLMEKKRRQRINKSLEELKKLITDPQRKESYSKLEKADILDMTVKFVRAITQNRVSTDSQMALNYFLTGFSSCEQTTLNFLSASQSEAAIMPHLRGHLLRERESTAHRFLHAKLTTQMTPLRAHNYSTSNSGPPAPTPSMMTSSPIKQILLRHPVGDESVGSPMMLPSSGGKGGCVTLCSPGDSLSSSCSSSSGGLSVWRPW